MIFDPRQFLARSSAYQAFRKLVSKDGTDDRLLHEFLKIEPGHRVLDIGCGPADILDRLPAGVDYHGYDVEPNYIAAAEARYGERGSFAVKAVSPGAVQGMGSFDVAIALGVLHHLTDSECDTLFAGAAEVLGPEGRLITLDGVYVSGQHPIAKLMLVLDRGRYVRSQESYVELAARHFRSVKTTILHDLIAIPYTHIIVEAQNPL